MTTRQILLGATLAAFSVLTAHAAIHHGITGIVSLHLTNSAGLQVFADLVISLLLLLGFVREDARTNGLSFAPYLVLTLALGSIGPLVYLLRREGKLAQSRQMLQASAR